MPRRLLITPARATEALAAGLRARAGRWQLISGGGRREWARAAPFALKSRSRVPGRGGNAAPLDGCQESIACARSEHGSRRDGSRSGVALGFERGTWARRRGRPVGRVSEVRTFATGRLDTAAGRNDRGGALASASRANWFRIRPEPEAGGYLGALGVQSATSHPERHQFFLCRACLL